MAKNSREQFSLIDLAKIVERESKESTYKFALLRGTIDIIQNSPNLKHAGDNLRIYYPIGSLVLKWIEYYWPLFNKKVPQRPGATAFEKELNKVIELYPIGDRKYSSLHYDLRKGISEPLKIATIFELLRKVRETISRQPMYYIGSSIGRSGELYAVHNNTTRLPHKLSIDYILGKMGSFSIPADFHHVLATVGSFVAGTHSILFKWAEFSSGMVNDGSVKSSDVVELLSDSVSVRDVEMAKNFFRNVLDQDSIRCTWSGKKLAASTMHIDHILPFSAIQNNDLWNLLPAYGNLNIRKKDDIPPMELLGKSVIKDRIIFYWEEIVRRNEEQFFREVEVALTGMDSLDRSNWKNTSYKGLMSLSRHLIEKRGLNPWTYTV